MLAYVSLRATIAHEAGSENRAKRKFYAKEPAKSNKKEVHQEDNPALVGLLAVHELTGVLPMLDAIQKVTISMRQAVNKRYVP